MVMGNREAGQIFRDVDLLSILVAMLPSTNSAALGATVRRDGAQVIAA